MFFTIKVFNLTLKNQIKQSNLNNNKKTQATKARSYPLACLVFKRNKAMKIAKSLSFGRTEYSRVSSAFVLVSCNTLWCSLTQVRNQRI